MTSDYNAEQVYSGLTRLFQDTNQFSGWHNKLTAELIRVGEYGLAFDGIADAYLINNKEMTPDQFQIFEKLAGMMELEKDPEYSGVAMLRARGMGKPA